MKIAVIGCGVMGSALARHFAKRHQVLLSDREVAKSKKLAEEIQGVFIEDPAEAAQAAEAILLAIKPKDLFSLSEEISSSLPKGKILLSVLAGTPLPALRKLFPFASIVRLMPNLALTVGEGVIGIAEDGTLSKDKSQEIFSLFSGLGLVFSLPDAQMEALTAFSASSPAFFYVILEAMIEAGIDMGFSAQEAREITIQTCEGALALLKQSGKHPAELKWQISSPGGTTIAGIKALEQSAVRSGVWGALLAAYHKGKEMAR